MSDTSDSTTLAKAKERSLFFEPQEVATVKVEGKTFIIHKALLVQDSPYFERALNGGFIEGQTQTIEMGDDVTAEEFGVYSDCIYRCGELYSVKNTAEA